MVLDIKVKLQVNIQLKIQHGILILRSCYLQDVVSTSHIILFFAVNPFFPLARTLQKSIP